MQQACDVSCTSLTPTDAVYSKSCQGLICDWHLVKHHVCMYVTRHTQADMYLFSAVPAFQAQQQPGKVELQGPVSRAVTNSLVVVIQGPAVLVCRH